MQPTGSQVLFYGSFIQGHPLFHSCFEEGIRICVAGKLVYGNSDEYPRLVATVQFSTLPTKSEIPL